MDPKTKEMIALAVSYAVNCHPCLNHHKEKAIEIGLTETEMLEALEVGEMVRKGAFKFTKELANELFSYRPSEMKCCADAS